MSLIPAELEIEARRPVKWDDSDALTFFPSLLFLPFALNQIFFFYFYIVPVVWLFRVLFNSANLIT